MGSGETMTVAIVAYDSVTVAVVPPTFVVLTVCVEDTVVLIQQLSQGAGTVDVA